MRGAGMSEWRKENLVTMVCTTALVLGLYSLGAGAHAGWGFLLLLNLNCPVPKRPKGK